MTYNNNCSDILPYNMRIGRNYKNIEIENVMNILFRLQPTHISVIGQLQRFWYTVRFGFYTVR